MSRLWTMCPRKRSTRASPRSWPRRQSRKPTDSKGDTRAARQGCRAALSFAVRNAGCRQESGVLAQDPQHPALDCQLLCRHVNGGHLHIRRLEPDPIALNVIALQGGLAPAHQRGDALARAGRLHALYQHIVTMNDVFVAHRVAAYFEGKNVFVSNNIAERNGL